MIIIQANNIHESGARLLLLGLMDSLTNLANEHQVIVFLDSRFSRDASVKFDSDTNISIESVKPSVISRFFSEISIWRLAKKNKGATLLCFGNLPPLIPSNAKVVLYFQTVLYFKRFKKHVSGIRSKGKIFLETVWIRFGLRAVDDVYVQSHFVKNCLCREFDLDEKKVTVFPFADIKSLECEQLQSQGFIRNGFFYPALGTPHKNHQLLIDAWTLLAKDNIFPLLVLTIDPRFKMLLDYLEKARHENNIRVVNLGLISRQEVLKQLSLSQAMIFPSLCESFGLPLLEAKKNGVPVIGSELDFVRDILNPSETFDPNSALSISRAVKRFLKIGTPSLRVNSADAFVDLLLNPPTMPA